MPWVTPEEPLWNDHLGSNSCQGDQPRSYTNKVPDTDENAQEDFSDNSFEQWLGDIGGKFKVLSPEQRNRTLDFLIGISEGPQLYHLSNRLNILLKRDFLTLLPQDLVLYLVRFFGAETMKSCCLVSRHWKTIIHSCNGAWKSAALAKGVNLEGQLFRKASEFKDLYLTASWYTKQLKAGTTFDTSVMYGHRDRIMTVYYNDNVIATGSDDHTVRLWNCTTGICFRILHTHNTVAAVKFDSSRIITASFNTTATLWDLPTGEAVTDYVGHVAAIFSIDYNAKLDLLITGSADSTVKVWLLSSAVLLRTLTQHRSSWITQVCLYWDPMQEAYTILSRDDAVIHMWRLNRSHKDINNKQITDPSSCVLLPGWQVSGHEVTYTTYSPPSSYVVTRVNLQDPDTPTSFTKFTLQDSVPQGFLGCGQQFTVLLLAVDGERSEISIVQNSMGQVIATVPMPLDYRPSKRSSTFTLGDRGWLDGFICSPSLGVYLVACLRDNGILQLRWRSPPCRKRTDSQIHQ